MKRNWLVKLWGTFILLIVGFLLYIFFSEFYIVGINKNSNSAYAFGNVNENQWYYQSAQTYSLYNLFCGLIFLIPFIVLVYSLLKSKEILILRTAMIVCFMVLIFLVFKL